MIDDVDFYKFRSEIRKKLGRVIFYPQNIKIFTEDIVTLITEHEDMARIYVNKFTTNEKEALFRVLNYLKETRMSPHVEGIIQLGFK